MSIQVSAVPEALTQSKNRPSADFHPSIWGDYFLSLSVQKEHIEKMKQQVEELKEEVKGLIMKCSHKKPLQKLELIDAIQRLGVSYHFEREINEALEKIYNSYGFLVEEDDDLYTISLWFRLLRQHGYYISCDVFNKFKYGDGEFKASLTADVPAMLSLYEAAHLCMHGEEILDGALVFTTTHLQSELSNMNPDLAASVIFALNRSIRKNIPRSETRHYISFYPKEKSHNKTLLKLAQLDFNVLQALHQKEVANLSSRWWKNLDFRRKLPYARDRLVELYSWIYAMFFEPKYSLARVLVTKVVAMASIIDDTFDAYGTYEEIKLFTESIIRWDISAKDVLPDYMKLIYQEIVDNYSQFDEHTNKEGRSYGSAYAKQAMKELVQAYFAEVGWFHSKCTPGVEEYISNGEVSATYYALITASFLFMGEEIATEEAFIWASNKPKIIKAASLIGRLMNDITSHKFERKREHCASAVECCMEQHGVEAEEAYKMLHQEIENAWKDINQELMKPTAVATPVLDCVLNLARMSDVSYKDGDSYTNPHLIKDTISLLLVDPITTFLAVYIFTDTQNDEDYCTAGSKAEQKKAEKIAFDVNLEKFDTAAKIKVIKEGPLPI
ncbi:alpha-copaene synthase-like [Ziziphus jujuba]|uniref:Alpha-copaene synthase-like n=1 Tax=Ziziphus jujuba TaxID=326968 RepID=A0ABM4A7H3_ZIZJJ|nr:alpha-copaene synthase-like [Ziziphus jujuba]